ncbi:MAG: cupin domain-containing protein [Acidobacteriota bacterium]
MTHSPNPVVRNIQSVEPAAVPRCRGTTIQVMLGAESLDDQVVEVGAGDFILIPAGTPHWYENRGSETVRFVCVIPRVAEYQTEWLEEPAD